MKLFDDEKNIFLFVLSVVFILIIMILVSTVLGSKAVKWNFTKFLVDKNGKVIRRYAPKTEPEAIRKDIEDLL